MPFDPTPAEDIHAAPLPHLTPDGAWQIELAHDRATHTILWITGAQGSILLDGRRQAFGPHSAIFIPAGALWAAELGPRSKGHVLSVPASDPAALPDAPMQTAITDPQDQAHITGLFEAIAREQRDSKVLWRRAVQCYSELLAIQLRRHHRSEDTGQARAPAALRLSQAYCRRVAECFSEHASMADHAAALNVTPTHLTRVCKSQTGKTAAALLTARQLHAARTLLISTAMPMRDIASELGFGSAAYFTRFITQHTGATPSALRKAAKQKLA